MLLNNIVFIIRRFIRNKLTTSLHIIGLTLGIAVCLMIGLFIKYETSFDTYQPLSKNTYRVNHILVDPGEKRFDYSTPFPLANQIRKDVPGVRFVTQVHHPYLSVVEINSQKRFKQPYVMMTDPEFLDVFDVKVVEGNAKDALKRPYYAVLTESAAKKFFGNENALNKTFLFNEKFNITVGAVVKDFPPNTHLAPTVLLSFADNGDYLLTSPTNYGAASGGSTFIVLPDGKIPGKALLSSLQGIYDRLLNSNQEWMRKGSHAEIELQPLRNVHFNAMYGGGGIWVKSINSSWLYFFGSVGLAVLVLACINFINLSTAQSLNRAKEIGVRKVVGAGRFHLVLQFLSESLLLVLLASILALLVTWFAVPYVNNFSEKHLTLDFLDSPLLVVSLLIGILLTALLAGIYPAWIITKFHPSTTLKSGSVTQGLQSIFLRKGLVIVQFTISVCLLMSLLLIGKQMNFIRNKNLGFDKDNVVVLTLPMGGLSAELFNHDRRQVFDNELAKIKEVKGWTFSTSPPSGDEFAHWGTSMNRTGFDDPDQKLVLSILTDAEFPSVYNLQLVAGRFFQASDTSAISESIPGRKFPKTLVNEKAAKELGFASPQEAIGQRFWAGLNDWDPEIVGVVKDFNVGSLHNEVKSTLITQHLPFCQFVSVKITGANVPGTISDLETAFTKVFPRGFFEFNFLDQTLDALYKTEARLYGLFKVFSMLALLISCLGLWGLISYAAKQRVKEIGIRKVLGASVSSIVSLLTKDFVMLVGIAIVIATPLAYWGIYKWLQDFAFRINIGWTLFVIAGSAAILIALVTVGIQAFKAATANPVNSLRNE